MAKRRMISVDVINTDKFIAMSMEARGLYMYLNAMADDDGFIASPIGIMNMVGSKMEFLAELVNSKYVIQFDSGICLIRHWYQHNQIKKDRYSETIYVEERAQVQLINKVYFFNSECVQNVSKVEPQISVDKKSLEKNSLVESNETNHTEDARPPTSEEIKEYADSIGYKDLNVDAFVAYYDARDWRFDSGQKIENWQSFVRLWKARERTSSGSNKPTTNPFNNFEQRDYDFAEIEKMITTPKT